MVVEYVLAGWQSTDPCSIREWIHTDNALCSAELIYFFVVLHELYFRYQSVVALDEFNVLSDCVLLKTLVFASQCEDLACFFEPHVVPLSERIFLLLNVPLLGCPASESDDESNTRRERDKAANNDNNRGHLC